MHNHNDDNSFSMMWMMAICCLAPVILAFIAGRSGRGLSVWWIIGIVAVCLGVHLLMHRRRKSKNEQLAEQSQKPDVPNQL